MNSISDSDNPNGWPADIHRVFRAADIRQVGYVPDSGHAELIRLCTSDPDIVAVPLTSEEEGVSLVAGAWLGGQRGAILMQSSGVGNCMNLFTLAANCHFPVLLLVTMRGEWEEFNPWQVPMGRSAGPMIEMAGGTVYRAEDAASVGPVVEAAASLAFNTSGLVAVALAQKLIGAKTFGRAAGEE